MLGTPDMVLTRLFILCFFIVLFFVTYFETGFHASQSGFEFWMAEVGPELLTVLPPPL